ncbi:MAG: hypothetical protein RL562_354 [Planctomycetota bacterium]
MVGWLAVCVVWGFGSVGIAQEEPPKPVSPPGAGSDPQEPESARQPSDPDDPETLKAVLARIRKSHLGERDTAEDPLDRFRAALRFKLIAADQASNEIDVAAEFLMPRYLRYRVEEPGEVLERGWDDRGAWSRVGDRVESIAGREREQEREAVRQQVGLARQLLSFLDPASVLGALSEVKLLGVRDLAVGRKEVRTCHVVRGVATRFPMFAPPADGPAEPRCVVQAWFDVEDDRLTAVVITPLGEGERPIALPEFVLLRGYAEGRGVAVPTSLLVYQGPPGSGRPLASVVVRAIDLDPDGLSKDLLRRPG